ncbi:MAG: purine-nucleoside phosphorylase, partial [Gemmatimonadota bacterium]|nr:purine-nucleoside phosphorylase [Gemmatimonadota bacterium]MDQ3605727.1 purine-nucleoside phosphorylase [Gemmatimonadota bacterium]
VEVAVLQGRFHLYEGWDAGQVALPIRAVAALGARTLLITNAAGGIRPGMQPGDLMLIADHINLMSRSPLIGAVMAGEERFPDMSDPYDAELRRIVERTALELRIPLVQGVYAALLGPSYETPAEIRMLRALGADAAGMSTVPEVIVARALGMRVVGISCITNLAAGLGGAVLNHDEVMEVGARVSGRLAALVKGILPAVVESSPAADG